MENSGPFSHKYVVKYSEFFGCGMDLSCVFKEEKWGTIFNKTISCF